MAVTGIGQARLTVREKVVRVKYLRTYLQSSIWVGWYQRYGLAIKALLPHGVFRVRPEEAKTFKRR